MSLKLAKRTSQISPSMTIAVDSKAKQMKKEGKDIIIFGAGEPDFPTPQNIKEAAIKGINNNFTRYTPTGGIPELKKAVADKFKRENRIDYDLSEVTISCGGKHTLFNAIMSVVGKGDEVILPSPYWVSYYDMIKIAEGTPVICNTGKNFKLSSADVRKKITGKTKLIILNSPSNPTGAVIDEKELKKIAEIAVGKNILMISDEVYEHFIYGGGKNKSAASLNDETKNLTITVNSLSKTYSMTGWRIGFCGANKEIIKSMESIQSQSTGNPTSIAQIAAVEALSGQQESVKEMVTAFEKRRNIMVKRLNEMGGVECIKPEGAFYCFPDISKTKMSSAVFSSKLLEESLVALVPGIAFGSDKHVRLSYAASVEDINKGMDRMEKWLKSAKH